MTRGNPDIGANGKAYAAKVRQQSEAKITAAKSRIEQRILGTGSHGEGKLTIAAVLQEAGLNRLYLEGKDRQADKRKLKDWLERARNRFQPTLKGAGSVPGDPALPVGLEGRFEALKSDFVKLQNAYVAAHLIHNDHVAELEEAKAKIEDLEAELQRLVQAHGCVSAS